MTQARHPERLRAFIGALAELIDGNPREGDLLHRGGKLLAQLVSHDDWLPDDFAQPGPRALSAIFAACRFTPALQYRQFCLGPGANARRSMTIGSGG